MLNIGNKNFMNLQEAVGWLLENNAMPFQSTANYAGNTEIAMSTLINPSPAKVRVGSIIFFADSKVSTVIGVTSNSFICSDEYNDLVDDIVYVSNVAINASDHLITTLSNGDTIDAGLIKQVSNFSINASQHLIANYNDGTSTDLGAIFSGNINISGTLNATAITGDSIIENMSGYSSIDATTPNVTVENTYTSMVKNGNKLTIVSFIKITRTGTTSNYAYVRDLNIPSAIGETLVTHFVGSLGGVVNSKVCQAFSNRTDYKDVILHVLKPYNSRLQLLLYNVEGLELNTTYWLRLEDTFLTSASI